VASSRALRPHRRRKCGLTPRSRRRPATAATVWPLQAMVEIVLPRPAGVCLHGRLSSNVRPRRNKLFGARGAASATAPAITPPLTLRRRSEAKSAALTSFGVRGKPPLGSTAAERRVTLWGPERTAQSAAQVWSGWSIQSPSCLPMQGVGARRGCSLHAWARRRAPRQAAGLL